MHTDVALGRYPLFACRRMWRLAVLAASLLLLLSACGKPESVPPTPNPTPMRVYKVTVDVRGAPGEFVSAEGNVQYQISRTWKCMPEIFFQGTPAVAFIHDVKFPLKKVTPTRFVGYVVGEDRFVSRDDYGLGVCEWEMQGFPGVELKNKGSLRFIAFTEGPECCPVKGTSIQRLGDWSLSPQEAEEKYSSTRMGAWGYEHVKSQGNQHLVTPDKFYFIDTTVERISP